MSEDQHNESSKPSACSRSRSPLGSAHKHYIGLCGKAYQVRVVDDVRQVLSGGEWITHTQFVDNLADDKNWDALYELAKGACLLNPKEVKRLLLQNTKDSRGA